MCLEVKGMSVGQLIEQFEQFTRDDLVLLEREARKARLKKYGESTKQRWDGKKFELHSPPFPAEPKHSPKLPFMDLRTNLPMPEQPTANELEELRP
jgi:hypothetical protein